MGHNAVILVMLDALHEIEENQNFGRELSHAIRRFGRPYQEHVYMHGASVLHEAHADVCALLLTGGNRGELLGTTHNGGRFDEADEERLVLRRILKDRGYELRGRRKNSTDMDIVRKIGKIQESTDLRNRLLDLTNENVELRRRIAELEAQVTAPRA